MIPCQSSHLAGLKFLFKVTRFLSYFLRVFSQAFRILIGFYSWTKFQQMWSSRGFIQTKAAAQVDWPPPPLQSPPKVPQVTRKPRVWLPHLLGPPRSHCPSRPGRIWQRPFYAIVKLLYGRRRFSGGVMAAGVELAGLAHETEESQ